MANDKFNGPLDGLYTFKVKFTVDGVEYAVSKLELSAFDNSPPVIRVTVAATEVKQQLQLVTLAAALKTQATMVGSSGARGTKVYLFFNADTAGDNSTIIVSNWVLLPSGLGTVSVGNAVTAMFILAHPAILADTNTLASYNRPTELEQPVITGDNPYECFMNAMDEFSKQLGALDSGSEAEDDEAGAVDASELWEVNKVLAANAQASMAALKEHTRWAGPDGEAMPYADIWANSEYLPDTLWDYVYMFGSTPYNAFSRFLGDFGLTCSGVFNDEPMCVYPFAPWGKSVGYIYDSEIENIQVPTGEQAIAGTVVVAAIGAQREFGYSPPGAYGQPGVDGDDTTPTIMYAYGWFFDFLKSLVGRIREVYIPRWMLMVQQRMLDDVKGIVHDGTTINDPVNVGAGGDAAAAADMAANDDEFAAVARAVAEDEFYRVFGLERSVSITTRLMISTWQYKAFGAFHLRPGTVISVRSVETNEDLLYFYINRVEHTIDVNGTQAYTNLTGAFYRTPEGVRGEDGEDGEVLISPELIKSGKAMNMYSGFGYTPPGGAG